MQETARSPIGIRRLALAGGRSRRLGFDKRWFRWGDQTLLELSISRLEALLGQAKPAARPAPAQTHPLNEDVAAKLLAKALEELGVTLILGAICQGLSKQLDPNTIMVAWAVCGVITLGIAGLFLGLGMLAKRGHPCVGERTTARIRASSSRKSKGLTR